MLYSVEQYRERTQRNARGSRFQYVPEPFDEGEPHDWTPVWSLSRQAFRYLPLSMCYYGYDGPGAASGGDGSLPGEAPVGSDLQQDHVGPEEGPVGRKPRGHSRDVHAAVGADRQALALRPSL